MPGSSQEKTAFFRMLNQPGNYSLARKAGVLFHIANLISLLAIVLAIWVIAALLFLATGPRAFEPGQESQFRNLHSLLKTGNHSFSWIIQTGTPALEFFFDPQILPGFYQGIPRYLLLLSALTLCYFSTRILGVICTSLVASAIAANIRCMYLQSLFGIQTGTGVPAQASGQNLFRATQTRIRKIILAVEAMARIQFAWIRSLGIMAFSFWLSPVFTLECLGLLICWALVMESGRTIFQTTAKSLDDKKKRLERLFHRLDSSIIPSFSKGWMHAWVSRMKEYQAATRDSESTAAVSCIFLSNYSLLYALTWAFLIISLAVAKPAENWLGSLDWAVCGSLVLIAGESLATFIIAHKNLREGFHEAFELAASLTTETNLPDNSGDQNFPEGFSRWTLDMITIATPQRLLMDKANFSFLSKNFYAFEGLSPVQAKAMGFVLEGATQPTGGEIRFDDLNLRRIKTRELGKNLTFIHPFGLLDATVDELISDFAPVRDFAKIQEAAKLARIHSAIMKQKLGYQTRFDESLDASGDLAFGIALARAYYLDIKTLIILPPQEMNSETQESLFLSGSPLAGKTILFINPGPQIAHICRERFVLVGHEFTSVTKPISP